MMKTLAHYLVTLLLLLPLFSCSEPEDATPVPPESLKVLLDAYYSTQMYIGIEQKQGITTLTWYDESTYDITDMDVDDCLSKSPKVMGFDKKGYWMLDGISTGIKKDESLPDVSSYPIYSYFNNNGLYVRLSNGNSFLIRRTEPRKRQLPVIYLTTESAVTSKDYYVKGGIEIHNPDKLYCDVDKFEASMNIKGRGNSTWGMPKKPYRIKLDTKAELLGMPASKNWALLAEYADKSLLRNTTAMELSRIAGFSWTPKLRHVEVYMNNQYIGVYTLAEHKEVAKNKVNIDVDAGDMYFELEQNQDELVCWWTEHGAPVMFSDPENPSAEQIAYAKQYFKDFETALWNKDFDEVYNLIDVDSFVNYYIVQELTKNIDGNIRKSTFLTKTVGGKLEMYHVWDFDLTLGNCNYYDDGNNGPTGWWIKDYGYWGKNHGWYYRLFMDKNFVKKVQERWEELLPELRKVPDFIDEQKNMMGDAPARNFQRWKILSTYVWPNYKILGSYEEEVRWLKTFYTERLDWIDKNLSKL